MSIQINKILIIQSLGADERKTGNEVETRIRHTAAKLNLKSDIVELINISTRSEFFAALREIKEYVQKKVLHPIVHVEMHGSPEGLALSADGEFIKWNELKEPIREINILSKNNMFISLATCFGGHFLNLYVGEHGKRCPFHSYLGPTREVSFIEVEESFCEFFQTLIESNSFYEAMIAIQKTIGDKTTFSYVDCNGFYEMLIEQQRQLCDNPAYIQDWVDELKMRAKQFGSTLDEPRLTAVIKSQINPKAIIDTYENYRAIFLHQDSQVE